jgi:hypothetical protein
MSCRSTATSSGSDGRGSRANPQALMPEDPVAGRAALDRGSGLFGASAPDVIASVCRRQIRQRPIPTGRRGWPKTPIPTSQIAVTIERAKGFEPSTSSLGNATSAYRNLTEPFGHKKVLRNNLLCKLRRFNAKPDILSRYNGIKTVREKAVASSSPGGDLWEANLSRVRDEGVVDDVGHGRAIVLGQTSDPILPSDG